MVDLVVPRAALHATLSRILGLLRDQHLPSGDTLVSPEAL